MVVSQRWSTVTKIATTISSATGSSTGMLRLPHNSRQYFLNTQLNRIPVHRLLHAGTLAFSIPEPFRLNDIGVLKRSPSKQALQNMRDWTITHACAHTHTHTYLSAPRVCRSLERHWDCRVACAVWSKAGWQTAPQTCQCYPHGPKHSPEAGKKGGRVQGSDYPTS